MLNGMNIPLGNISGGMDSSFVGVVTTPKAPPMCMVGRVNELWIQ